MGHTQHPYTLLIDVISYSNNSIAFYPASLVPFPSPSPRTTCVLLQFCVYICIWLHTFLAFTMRRRRRRECDGSGDIHSAQDFCSPHTHTHYYSSNLYARWEKWNRTSNKSQQCKWNGSKILRQRGGERRKLKRKRKIIVWNKYRVNQRKWQ